MRVKVLKIVFLSAQLSKADIPKFRGFLANKYPNYDLIHNHLKDGELRYTYPQIQFKTIKGHPAIICIRDGISVLKQVFMELNNIKIGDKEETIFEKSISLKEEEFGVAERFIDYQFLSPWMALNQENYEKYKAMNPFEQMQFLKHILRENLKTISKGFNYTIPDIEKIRVDGNFEKKEVKFKNIKMVCFTGSFLTNFYIPDYLGIGKQVARGFGMVKKI
jgi:hypothetical protein